MSVDTPILNTGGAATPDVELDQEHHHQGLHARRDRGLARGAGAGRFLGALVRALPAADADPGEGRARGEGRGQAGQAQYRRPSADPGADGRPVDPSRIRLPGRPSGRRLHGSAARSRASTAFIAQAGRRRGRQTRRPTSRRPRRRLPPATSTPPRSCSARCCSRTRENAQAIAGLAKCYIKTGDLARAEQTLALVPPAKAESRAGGERARRPRACAQGCRDRRCRDAQGQARRGIRKTPQTRFDLALALNAKGDRQRRAR